MTARTSAASIRGMCQPYAADAVAGAPALHRRIVEEIAGAVEALKGPAAAALVRAHGLEQLHRAIDATDVTAVRDRVLERVRDDLLRLAVAIGRDVLGWDREFYVDDYLIVRVNFPYEIARHADPSAENPGVGRVSPHVRDVASARRTVDPVYDPRAYHRGHPPAAWAHGPHVDSWSGHSRDGVNVWWAISNVPADAGMAMYPDVPAASVRCDPRSLYADDTVVLPPPAMTPLAAGTMLVFDPEMLHGTHLNVTPDTRVAVSIRLNSRRPEFDATCFYAREFWRRASDVAAGVDRVLHLRREDNLAAPRDAQPPPLPPEMLPPRTVRAAPQPDRTVHVDATVLGGARGEGAVRIVVDAGERRIVLVRTGGDTFAFDAACPHYGRDLSRGGIAGVTVACPGCALAFDLRTGHSDTPSLELVTFAVTERGGTIVIDARA